MRVYTGVSFSTADVHIKRLDGDLAGQRRGLPPLHEPRIQSKAELW